MPPEIVPDKQRLEAIAEDPTLEVQENSVRPSLVETKDQDKEAPTTSISPKSQEDTAHTPPKHSKSDPADYKIHRIDPALLVGHASKETYASYDTHPLTLGHNVRWEDRYMHEQPTLSNPASLDLSKAMSKLSTNSDEAARESVSSSDSGSASSASASPTTAAPPISQNPRAISDDEPSRNNNNAVHSPKNAEKQKSPPRSKTSRAHSPCHSDNKNGQDPAVAYPAHMAGHADKEAYERSETDCLVVQGRLQSVDYHLRHPAILSVPVPLPAEAVFDYAKLVPVSSKVEDDAASDQEGSTE